MLGHEDKTVRAKSVNIIQKIRYAEERNQESEWQPVRGFHLPRCIFAETLCTGNTQKTTAVGMVSPILLSEKIFSVLWASINQKLYRYRAIR